MTTQVFKVTGMTCGHCVNSVTEEVSEVPGVSNVQVNLEKAELKFDSETEIPFSIIEAAVKEAGYEVVA
jgi:copper chaperone